MSSALYRFQQRLAQWYWFLPADLHERQRYIGSLLPHGQRVLDVGGEQKILSTVLEAREFVTVNVEKIGDTDIVYDGQHLPFGDGDFEIVLAIDVLEHVPAPARQALITEMLRVASQTVLISAPLGTPEHIEAEKELYQLLRDQNVEVTFLKEHIERGLPTPTAVTGWAQHFGGTLRYAGDYRLAAWLLRLHAFEFRRWPRLNHALFFFKLLVNGLCNVLLYPWLIDRTTSQATTNRFYLLIRKPNA